MNPWGSLRPFQGDCKVKAMFIIIFKTYIFSWFDICTDGTEQQGGKLNRNQGEARNFTSCWSILHHHALDTIFNLCNDMGNLLNDALLLSIKRTIQFFELGLYFLEHQCYLMEWLTGKPEIFWFGLFGGHFLQNEHTEPATKKNNWQYFCQCQNLRFQTIKF